MATPVLGEEPDGGQGNTSPVLVTTDVADVHIGVEKGGGGGTGGRIGGGTSVGENR